MKTLTAIAAALVITAAACGDDSAPGAAPAPANPGTSLTITFDSDGKGSDLKTWTLTCDPAGGDHPDAQGACTTLAAANEPFAPLPTDAICTEIYGGPSIATIKGSWRGQPVDARYTRENGCNISRWDAAGQAIPAQPASP